MIQGKAEKLFIGNITTMDDIKPFAEAMTILDTDLLNDKYSRLLTAKVIATAVDGDIVYSAGQ